MDFIDKKLLLGLNGKGLVDGWTGLEKRLGRGSENGFERGFAKETDLDQVLGELLGAKGVDGLNNSVVFLDEQRVALAQRVGMRNSLVRLVFEQLDGLVNDFMLIKSFFHLYRLPVEPFVSL